MLGDVGWLFNFRMEMVDKNNNLVNEDSLKRTDEHEF